MYMHFNKNVKPYGESWMCHLFALIIVFHGLNNVIDNSVC